MDAGATKNQPQRAYFFSNLRVFTESLLVQKPGIFKIKREELQGTDGLPETGFIPNQRFHSSLSKNHIIGSL